MPEFNFIGEWITISNIFNKKIAPGITLLGVTEPSLKTNRITVSAVVAANNSNCSAYALMPGLLSSCGSEFPNYTALRCRLADLYGASISANCSGHGDNKILSISIASIDNRFALGGEDILLECTKLLLSLFLKPLTDQNGDFDAENLQSRKRIQSENITSLINNKRLYLKYNLKQLVCPNSGYGVSSLGTLEGTVAITPQSATATWRELLSSAEIIFSVVGASSGESALEYAENALKRTERNFSGKPQTQLLNIDNEVGKTEILPVVQAKAAFAFSTGIGANDSRLNALRLSSALFGGDASSLLFKNVREKLSLCYYCSAALDRCKGVITVDSGLEHKNIPLAKNEILAQLNKIKTGDFTDEELSAARKGLVNSMRSGGDSAASLEGYYVWRIADGSELITPEQTAEKIDAVTRAEVIEAANCVKLCGEYIITGEAQ